MAQQMVHSLFTVEKWPIWLILITCFATSATVKHFFSGNTEHKIESKVFGQRNVLREKMGVIRRKYQSSAV